MVRAWMSHVTHINRSSENVMLYAWISHVTHMNRWYRTHQYGACCTMSHTWIRHVPYTWVMWHEWVVSHMWMSHVTRMNESWLVYEWVMSHMNWSYSCPTHEWVMSHTCPIHISEWFMSHTFTSRDSTISVCCSVLQSVAVRCSVLQCVAAWCSMLQCVAVCCSVLQHLREASLRHPEVAFTSHDSTISVCCSVLQCVAVCCSVLQCAASPQRSLGAPSRGGSYIPWLNCVQHNLAIAPPCNTVIRHVTHTAPHCNTLQHTATQCNTRHIPWLNYV